MKLQKLYSYVRQAIDDYNMIEDGDKIAVGMSGGKDSYTLLYALSGLREFYPKKFDIVSITVDLGYEGFDTKPIKNVCDKLNVEYIVKKTQIAQMLKDNGCSLCARLRKGAFGETAAELNCNKMAYAHNMDDLVETMMLSLIYEGRFSCFEPVTRYDDTCLTLIRPLIYVPAGRVRGFAAANDIPIVKNPCPYDNNTERMYVRELLYNIEKHAPGTKARMMTAVRKGLY
ncbi:MAG: tRNA 2-thiocytidine(32) synthetase TtcA [Lachnospiraceae bacterium]|nr:tRNA 2-thiocytidine(32) synthetase TtcA [Lachnospiraceae bacterium]